MRQRRCSRKFYLFLPVLWFNLTLLNHVKGVVFDLQTGRRPSGVCGAALFIAAHIHGFERSKADVVRVHPRELAKLCVTVLGDFVWVFWHWSKTFQLSPKKKHKKNKGWSGVIPYTNASLSFSLINSARLQLLEQCFSQILINKFSQIAIVITIYVLLHDMDRKLGRDWVRMCDSSFMFLEIRILSAGSEWTENSHVHIDCIFVCAMFRSWWNQWDQ